MRKKEKFFLFLIVFLLFVSSGRFPQIVLSAIPTTEVIIPVKTTYTPYITCDGVVKDNSLKEVYATSPLVVSSVTIKTGDWVEKGEIIAEIDLAASCAVYEKNTQSSDITEYLKDYGEFVRQYGVEEQLEEFFSQAEEQNNQPNSRPTERYITAQEDGFITTLNMTPGQLCEVGEQIYSISSGQSYTAELQVLEDDVSKIKVGDRVILTSSMLGNDKIQAVVESVSPVVTKKYNGLQSESIVEVEAVMLDYHPMIKTNMNVSAKIATDEAKSCLFIPYESVSQDEDNREYVLQIKDGKAERCYIEIENELPDCVQVDEGLENTVAIVYQPENYHKQAHFKLKYRENWYD